MLCLCLSGLFPLFKLLKFIFDANYTVGKGLQASQFKAYFPLPLLHSEAKVGGSIIAVTPSSLEYRLKTKSITPGVPLAFNTNIFN